MAQALAQVAEALRVHNTYADMVLNVADPNMPFVAWGTDRMKPANAFARRLAEKEFLETMQHVQPEPMPVQPALQGANEAVQERNDLLAERQAAAIVLLQNYSGRDNVESIDREMNDMQLIASGHSGIEAMKADEEALDLIPVPNFGLGTALSQNMRKNFLATINNATYKGGKEGAHEGNLLTMILSGLKNVIETEGLSEEPASQLTMACFRGDALDLFMIHRRQPHGYVTFWSLIQALSKTQISPTEAIQRISKLKQAKIPSQGISSVITEIIRLNHYTLPSNQPKAERDEQFKTSVLRDLRDIVQCLYASFTNQVQLKEREHKAAIEAQRAALRSKGDHHAAAALSADPVACLVHAMINILHVESEGSRIEFGNLDDAMGATSSNLFRNNRDRRQERRQPRMSAITQIPPITRRMSPFSPRDEGRPRQHAPANRTPARQDRQQERTYPQCKRCGKHHLELCKRYMRSAKFPCSKCKDILGLTLMHHSEDCNQTQGYSNFANRTNERQVAAVAPTRRGPRPQEPRQNEYARRAGVPSAQYHARESQNRQSGSSRPNGGRPFNNNGQRGPAMNSRFEPRGLHRVPPRVSAVQPVPRSRGNRLAITQQ